MTVAQARRPLVLPKMPKLNVTAQPVVLEKCKSNIPAKKVEIDIPSAPEPVVIQYTPQSVYIDLYGNEVQHLVMHITVKVPLARKHLLQCTTLLNRIDHPMQPIILDDVSSSETSQYESRDIIGVINSIDKSKLVSGYKSKRTAIYSLPELQKICKSLGIPSAGNKSVLIDRITKFIHEYS